MSEAIKKSKEYFSNGLYCSQAVFGAMCQKYGMDTDTAFKVSCGLNSGCRCADICGAVSGAILVIGLKYGDNQQLCNSKTEEFITIFKDKNESIICRDILGYDISTSKGKQEFMNKKLFNTVCAEFVASAVETLEKLGY